MTASRLMRPHRPWHGPTGPAMAPLGLDAIR